MINRAVADIPHADRGFSLIFSASPFPGHQFLEWRRSGGDGNWYCAPQFDLEGRLRRALFRYFDEAPKELFVEVGGAWVANLRKRKLLCGRQGRQAETKSAPIRYVAELLGYDAVCERAIRWLIALVVLGCDQLVIALTAAASARRSITSWRDRASQRLWAKSGLMHCSSKSKPTDFARNDRAPSDGRNPFAPAHQDGHAFMVLLRCSNVQIKKSILIATYETNADSSSTLRWTMTATALQVQPRRSHRGRSFTRLVLHLINAFREAREIASRYEQLSHLSDVELAVRKMRREDLPRIALTGRA
jgi:hypothetical protein